MESNLLVKKCHKKAFLKQPAAKHRLLEESKSGEQILTFQVQYSAVDCQIKPPFQTADKISLLFNH
jgi:hypothetical protein